MALTQTRPPRQDFPHNNDLETRRKEGFERMLKFAKYCFENSPEYSGILQFEFRSGVLRKASKLQDYMFDTAPIQP